MLKVFTDGAQRCVEELEGVLAGRVPSQLRYDELRKLPVLTACINETMRIYPPVGGIGRFCAQDTILLGIHVPRGPSLPLPSPPSPLHMCLWGPGLGGGANPVGGFFGGYVFMGQILYTGACMSYSLHLFNHNHFY